MGIDIYLRWDGMTQQDEKAQTDSWLEVSSRAGHLGYLREAYHGPPYATHILMPEVFIEDETHHVEEFDGITIPVETLRERLPAAIDTAHERGHKVYNDPDGHASMADALQAFVTKAEELAKSGEMPRVLASW